MKICSVCKEEKPLESFHNSSIFKDRKNYRCKVCDRSAREKWAKENPEAYKHSARWKSLKHRLGVTKDQYLEMEKSQKGVCKICGLKKDRMVVDHCHSTNKIRAILCNSCNRGLGYFADNPEVLRNAANYVETH